MSTETRDYTVTLTLILYPNASSAEEALSIAYEAAFGNDPQELLGQAEVPLESLTAREGYWTSIPDENYE